MWKKSCSIIKTVFAFAIGLGIACFGMIIPQALLERQEQFWLEEKSVVEIQLQDAEDTYTEHVSYTVDEYCEILSHMGITDESINYHDPFGEQISMKEAVGTTVELLQIIFPKNTEEALEEVNFSLDFASLSSLVEDYYTNPQYSFWHLVITYEDDIQVTSCINALDGKVWGIRVETDIESELGNSILDNSFYPYYVYANTEYEKDMNDAEGVQDNSSGTEAIVSMTADIADKLTVIFYQYIDYMNFEETLFPTEQDIVITDFYRSMYIYEEELQTDTLQEMLSKIGLPGLSVSYPVWLFGYSDSGELGIFMEGNTLEAQSSLFSFTISLNYENFTTMLQYY